MESLQLLAQQARGLRRYFVWSILFVLIETLFEVLIPYLMADIIDVGVLQHDTSVFLSRGLLMGGCALLSLLFGMAYSRCAAKASALFAKALRKKEFDAIQTYSFGNLDHFETSGLITRMTSDVQVIQNAITGGIRPLARGPVMLVLGLLMSFLISWKLSLVFFAAGPVLALILVWIVSKVAPRYSVIQKSVDLLNQAVQENLVAIRLVKAFVREDFQKENFEKINKGLSTITADTFHYAQLNQPAFQLSMYTVLVILMSLGVQMIRSGSMQVGELTGILSYVMQIMNSFMMMSNVFLLLTRSMASVDRIAQVFREPVLLRSPEHGTRLADGSVVFDHVSMKYDPEAQEEVLSDVSFVLPSGSKTGIVGSTGSAKTSLVSLIPRLYDASSGTIRVGGQEVKDLDLHDLREDVGVVLQNNVLFSGSVRENLLWGNPEATQEDIDEACRIAAVDELLEKLPQGLETELGQNGSNVSGGQKQRICIARALLKRPKILIFDDSTSAVDTKTDARIREGLASMQGMTQIIVAQRLSSVAHCDQILVMDNGTIAAAGTHEELLQTCPIYQEIYASQTREADEQDAAASAQPEVQTQPGTEQEAGA